MSYKQFSASHGSADKTDSAKTDKPDGAQTVLRPANEPGQTPAKASTPPKP